MQHVCGTFHNMSLWVSLFICSVDMTYRSTKHASLVFSQSYNWNSDVCDMNCFKTVEEFKIPIMSYCHNESFIWERLAQTQRCSPHGHWQIFLEHIVRTSVCHCASDVHMPVTLLTENTQADGWEKLPQGSSYHLCLTSPHKTVLLSFLVSQS